jgi:hypothetical protein
MQGGGADCPRSDHEIDYGAIKGAIPKDLSENLKETQKLFKQLRARFALQGGGLKSLP